MAGQRRSFKPVTSHRATMRGSTTCGIVGRIATDDEEQNFDTTGTA